MSAATTPPRQATFLGHPLGLYVLFFTEMWERFSYYGMRALLMLYMVNYFKWPQKDASTFYKVYTSFVYVTPIIGGFLADRYLGNRAAVVIGAILMAIGHFLMAFEETPVFISALVFLILGNGMFKPNMSTQVGRLYPPNDGRRDGAYTIFYMGINLGAFLSPLACGWLADNTVGGYHAGFTLAGLGMVVGLLTYVLGGPLVKELDQGPPTGKATEAGGALTEAEAERAPSVLGPLAGAAPALLLIFSVCLLVAAPALYVLYRFSMGGLNVWDAVMVAIAGVCSTIVALVCTQVHGGVRDRVIAILALGVFVMFFWAAFEQAGNVQNVWADKHTDRFLTRPAEAPPLHPEVHDAPATTAPAAGEPERGQRGVWQRFATMFVLKPSAKPSESWGDWLTASLNPVPTAWFQSINALAIFVIAPVFAWLWITLDRRGLQPSIPMKMVLGLVFMALSMAVMLGAADQENKATTLVYSAPALPPGVLTDASGRLGLKDDAGHFEPFHAGRLGFDPASRTFTLGGVLPDNDRDRVIGASAPAAFQAKVTELKKLSKTIDDRDVKSVEVKLGDTPPGFDWKRAGIPASLIAWEPETRTLVAHGALAEKEVLALNTAAGDPTFRTAVDTLFLESQKFAVSPSWLLWSFVLATLGELCLSPVGLSMVSKLAPAKFATLLMGVWLLTSAFGNFAAGLAGEVWGTQTVFGMMNPFNFFLLVTVATAAAALVLLAFVRLLVGAMHGVK